MAAPENSLSFVFLGLSITSAWGNGHATTYRALIRELGRAGHEVLFLERDVEWYRNNRDTPSPEGCVVELYTSVDDLKARFARALATAQVVIVGSYVPDGAEVGEWVIRQARGLTAFYDIDTPVTLAKLARGDFEYLTPHLVAQYGLYLSFTGGPTLERLEQVLGSPAARHLPCSVDADRYAPIPGALRRWELGYLGTYSEDRQPTLERLLIEPARGRPEARFVVGGPSYPEHVRWPPNVERVSHVSPPDHPAFYAGQRLTLNVTRADMIAAGYSPSVRLFEAAACGVPIVSDRWRGLEDYFEPGREILLADSTEELLERIGLPDEALREVAQRARARVLREHTAAVRARQLVDFVGERLASTASRAAE